MVKTYDLVAVGTGAAAHWISAGTAKLAHYRRRLVEGRTFSG